MSGFGSFLAYGVSGLGLALAVLAYKLLNNEQRQVRPRSRIINATYVFMAFSITLTGVGLASEAMKKRDVRIIEQFDKNGSWEDVVAATRKNLANDQLPTEFKEGSLKKRESSVLYTRVLSGECRFFLAMARHPAKIDVSVRSKNAVVFRPQGTLPHMSYGRYCVGKGSAPFEVEMEIQMIDGESPFIMETYRRSQDSI